MVVRGLQGTPCSLSSRAQVEIDKMTSWLFFLLWKSFLLHAPFRKFIHFIKIENFIDTNLFMISPQQLTDDSGEFYLTSFIVMF